MEAKFSNKVKDVITFAREEALRLGHDYIGTEHLMLGMIRDGEGPGINLLLRSGVSLEQLKQNIENSTVLTSKGSEAKSLQNIPLTKQAEKVLRLTYLEAKYFKTNLVETDHLLMAILRDEDNVATQILEKYQVYYDLIKKMVEFQGGNPTKTDKPSAAMDMEDNEDDSRLYSAGSGSTSVS